MNLTTSSDKATLVNKPLGTGITLIGTPSRFCNINGTAYFTNGTQTVCPIDEGIVLSTGYASFLTRTATYTASAGLNYGSTDPQLYGIKNESNTDICYLQFQFQAFDDKLFFDYVF